VVCPIDGARPNPVPAFGATLGSDPSPRGLCLSPEVVAGTAWPARPAEARVPRAQLAQEVFLCDLVDSGRGVKVSERRRVALH
jgi:hypothetical protein